jgi:hypothetical protein
MEENEKIAAEVAVESPNQESVKQESLLGLDTGNRGDFRKKVNTILKGLVKANSEIVKDLQASHKDMQTVFTEVAKVGRYIQQDYEDKQETGLVLSFLLNCLGDEFIEYANDKGPYPLSLYFNVNPPVDKVTFVHLSIPSNKYRFIMKIDEESNLSLIKFSLLNDSIRNYNLANVAEEIDEKEPRPNTKRFKCTFTRESKLETTEDLNEVVFIEVDAKTATKNTIFDTAFYELYKKLYVTE